MIIYEVGGVYTYTYEEWFKIVFAIDSIQNGVPSYTVFFTEPVSSRKWEPTFVVEKEFPNQIHDLAAFSVNVREATEEEAVQLNACVLMNKYVKYEK